MDTAMLNMNVIVTQQSATLALFSTGPQASDLSKPTGLNRVLLAKSNLTDIN